MEKKPHHIRIVLALTVLSFLSTLAQAQTAAEAKESTIFLRVLCHQPVTGATDLKIAQKDAVLHDLTIVPSLFTDPLRVGRGPLVLANYRNNGEKLELDPILEITIPAAGNRFVLALFPSSENKPGVPYQHLLIRTDDLRFKSSDLFLFNLSSFPIGGTVGKKNFKLAPGESSVVTPAPEDAKGRMYQARFYYILEDRPNLFSDTRWPLATSARVYVFFFPDTLRRSVSYVSFREYQPFP